MASDGHLKCYIHGRAHTQSGAGISISAKDSWNILGDPCVMKLSTVQLKGDVASA